MKFRLGYELLSYIYLYRVLWLSMFFFFVIIYLVIFYLIFTEYAVVDTGHEFLTEKKKRFS